jgi:hypothetical protein
MVQATWADEQLGLLSERFPGWDIWYVRCYPNLLAWCARPKGAPISTIGADTPEHLAEYILEAIAEASLAG